MATVHWSLQVRGRVRPKAVLVDAEGRDVARVRRDGSVRAVRAGEAKDPEGRRWRVVGPGSDMRVSCEGEARATMVDRVLEIGDRTFGWRLDEDGSRTVRATSASGGGTVLRIDPGDGDAWATITIEDALPEPFGVVLAACVRLLEAEDPIWGSDGLKAGWRASRAEAAAVRGADAAGPGARDADREAPAEQEGSSADEQGSADGGAGSPDDGGVTEDPVASASDGAGDRPVPLDVQWALYVQGRARPRLLLSDGGEDALATLTVRGGPPGSLGSATDRDGRRWVAELDGGVVTMRCGSRAMARAEGQELTVGGRTLAWEASLDGARTATATDDEGVRLRVAPGAGDGGPWATVELDDALPAPLAATLVSLFVLLRVDALGRRA